MPTRYNISKKNQEYDKAESESRASLTSIYKSESSGSRFEEGEDYSVTECQKRVSLLNEKLKNGIEKGTKAEEKELRTEEKWKNGLEKNRKIVEKLRWLETEKGSLFFEEIQKRTKRGWKKYFKRYQEDLSECGKVSSLKVCLDCETRFSLTPRESCSKRICPLCARRHTKDWFWKYAPKILKYAKENRDYVPVHIILTLESKKAELLGSEIIRLQESWLKLRRRVFWKDSFTGAVSSIEVSWNKETGKPHPHIHILAFRQAWVTQEALSSEWNSISGACVVWIAMAYSKKNNLKIGNKWTSIDKDKGLIDAIIEASKYCVKSEDLSALTGKELAEFIVAVRGRNLKDVLGGLRGLEVSPEEELALIGEIKELQEVEEEKDSEQCWGCGSVNKVVIRVEYCRESAKIEWIDSEIEERNLT